MNILITSAGRRVSLVKAFKKELNELVDGGKVMTTDLNIKLSAACQVADKAIQLPHVNSKGYVQELLKVCLNNDIKIIIPTIDTELLLLATHAKKFIKKGIMPIISSTEFIQICRDKRKTHDFFVKNNINVAKEYSKYEYKLPMFIKPFNGSRSVDNYIIHKHEDLIEYHFKNNDLMFLEYLNHEDFEEFTCDLYYDKHHQLKSVTPRQRIEIRDGEVNKGITKRNELVQFIKENLKTVNGAVGCLTVQFFRRKDLKDVNSDIYGIEVNARFGGGYPLTYFAGANFPKWIIEEYILNQEIAFFDDWEDNLLMLRFDKEILVHG